MAEVEVAAEELSSLIVRPPREDDAEALVRLHERAWTLSHAQYADPSWVTNRPFEQRVEQWRVYCRGEGLPMWVADDGDVVVGFVTAAECEIVALYVDPARHGEGIGGVLLERGVEALRADGCRRAILWTIGASGQATSFYERHGWRPDGEEKNDREFGAVEVRYSREL